MKVIRTHSKNIDFVRLVEKLDAYLKTVDGDDHDFYHQYNGLENLTHVVLVYENDVAVGCGAFKKYADKSVEVKRMYVLPNFRGTKVAQTILTELEKWAKDTGYNRCILETGKSQKAAVKFYKKSNYSIIPNYGQYAGVENSICFEKIL